MSYSAYQSHKALYYDHSTGRWSTKFQVASGNILEDDPMGETTLTGSQETEENEYLSELVESVEATVNINNTWQAEISPPLQVIEQDIDEVLYQECPSDEDTSDSSIEGSYV